ncbi:MAG: hypothetical protein AAGE52_14835 [Myxococcota bacterium]
MRLAFLLVLGCSASAGWDGHDAHRHCVPALRGEPSAPSLTCEALHLCANEATLGAADTRRLNAALRRLGCAAP